MTTCRWSCSRYSEMLLRRLIVFALFGLAAALHAQTPPVEYETFMSQGKAVSCAVYGSP